MALAFQTLAVMFVTWIGVLGAGRIVSRLVEDGIRRHLWETMARLVLAIGIAIAVALRTEEHRAVLVFAVGAAYFAAVFGKAWFQAGQARRNTSSRKKDSEALKAVETSR